MTGVLRTSAPALAQCFHGRVFLRVRISDRKKTDKDGESRGGGPAIEVRGALCQQLRATVYLPIWAGRTRTSAPTYRAAPGMLIRSSPGRGTAGPSPGLSPIQDTTGPTGPERGSSWRGRCPVEGTGRAHSPDAGRAAIIRRFAGEGTARCRPVTSFCLEGTA